METKWLPELYSGEEDEDLVDEVSRRDAVIERAVAGSVAWARGGGESGGVAWL